ncbi:integral membrane sensor signal transduction histidine kinase [Methylocella silvestris BL2]|uniref:histidine kinase n=1 Tax=Methylocella silvestris (strain DSM 15510 / CIP 108128 / LMG 27833 / NCIMB 13906 / BL2) TaxID=395965 RepID=B8EHZ3_METSB|nr:integral membrane sensor signal transduction histidine kinase [Methylocella silvestris BL2]
MLRASVLRYSTLRHALLCIAFFSTAVFAHFGYVYWSTTSFVKAGSDRALSSENAALRLAYDHGGRAALATAVRRRVEDPGVDQASYLLTDALSAPIAGNIDAWRGAAVGREGFITFTATLPGAKMPPPRVRAHFDTLPNGDRLLVGRSVDDLDQFVRTIQLAFAAAIVLMFALAGFASVAVTRRTAGRIEAINATSREIMRSGLNSRIPLRGTRDEWDLLSANLNSMLDRIEELMEGVRQVSDNIAHDLRTPLSRMRGRLELAAKRRLSAEHADILIRETIGELDRVLALFSAILRIARLETQQGSASFRTVDLKEIAEGVAELFDAAAEEKGGHVNVKGAGATLMQGDRDLLFDALSNLTDNAVKYGGRCGAVTIEVSAGPAGPILAVSDRGPGIPPNEQKHVLKRFYRLEQSRTTPGNGLGLSLVAAVANVHGARITMQNNEPGLRFEIQFPGSDCGSETPEASRRGTRG